MTRRGGGGANARAPAPPGQRGPRAWAVGPSAPPCRVASTSAVAGIVRPTARGPAVNDEDENTDSTPLLHGAWKPKPVSGGTIEGRWAGDTPGTGGGTGAGVSHPGYRHPGGPAGAVRRKGAQRRGSPFRDQPDRPVRCRDALGRNPGRCRCRCSPTGPARGSAHPGKNHLGGTCKSMSRGQTEPLAPFPATARFPQLHISKHVIWWLPGGRPDEKA